MAIADQTKIIIGLSALAAISAVYYFYSKKANDRAKTVSTTAVMTLTPVSTNMLTSAQPQSPIATDFKVYAKTVTPPDPAPTMGGRRKSIVTASGTYSWPLELGWDWPSREISNRSGKSALIGLPKGETIVLPNDMAFSTITNSVSAAHWWA